MPSWAWVACPFWSNKWQAGTVKGLGPGFRFFWAGLSPWGYRRYWAQMVNIWTVVKDNQGSIAMPRPVLSQALRLGDHLLLLESVLRISPHLTPLNSWPKYILQMSSGVTPRRNVSEYIFLHIIAQWMEEAELNIQELKGLGAGEWRVAYSQCFEFRQTSLKVQALPKWPWGVS